MKKEIATHLPKRDGLRKGVREEGTYGWSLEFPVRGGMGRAVRRDVLRG